VLLQQGIRLSLWLTTAACVCRTDLIWLARSWLLAAIDDSAGVLNTMTMVILGWVMPCCRRRPALPETGTSPQVAVLPFTLRPSVARLASWAAAALAVFWYS
jgi:hypothetical protein